MVIALQWPRRRPVAGESLVVGFSFRPEGARRVGDDLLLGDGAGQDGATAASPALDDILAPFLPPAPAKATVVRAAAEVIDLAAYRARSPGSG